MTPALTPSLALGYLRELSADVRDGIVLGGSPPRALAGEARLADPALALLAAMGDAARAEGRSAAGAVFAARGGEMLVLVVCGPRALGGLARHDLDLVLTDLGVPVTLAGRSAAVTPALLERLLTAAQRGPGT